MRISFHKIFFLLAMITGVLYRPAHLRAGPSDEDIDLKYFNKTLNKAEKQFSKSTANKLLKVEFQGEGQLANLSLADCQMKIRSISQPDKVEILEAADFSLERPSQDSEAYSIVLTPHTRIIFSDIKERHKLNSIMLNMKVLCSGKRNLLKVIGQTLVNKGDSFGKCIKEDAFFKQQIAPADLETIIKYFGQGKKDEFTSLVREFESDLNIYRENFIQQESHDEKKMDRFALRFLEILEPHPEFADELGLETMTDIFKQILLFSAHQDEIMEKFKTVLPEVFDIFFVKFLKREIEQGIKVLEDYKMKDQLPKEEFLKHLKKENDVLWPAMLLNDFAADSPIHKGILNSIMANSKYRLKILLEKFKKDNPQTWERELAALYRPENIEVNNDFEHYGRWGMVGDTVESLTKNSSEWANQKLINAVERHSSIQEVIREMNPHPVRDVSLNFK